VTLPRLPSQPDDRDAPVIVEPRRTVLEVVEHGDSVVYIVEPVAATGPRGSGWYSGHSAPGTIAGSQAGDMYLDLDTGDVYVLS
jgi:hypothetical protein